MTFVETEFIFVKIKLSKIYKEIGVDLTLKQELAQKQAFQNFFLGHFLMKTNRQIGRKNVSVSLIVYFSICMSICKLLKVNKVLGVIYCHLEEGLIHSR